MQDYKRIFAINVIVLFLCVFCSFSANAKTGKVVGVTDGDTIKVIIDGIQTDVRLYGIDCPEKKMPFGQAARNFTAEKLSGQDVSIDLIAIDKYGRTVALVKIGDKILQEEILTAGLAWVYPEYCKKPFCGRWMALQEISVVSHGGLWADQHPEEPWLWRKEH